MARIPVLSRLRIDPYILAILAMVGLAALLPARGVGATGFGYATDIAIGLLFFLYGARLSPQTALAGAKHWRLHLVVFCATYVMFPLLGIAARLLVPTILSPDLYVGVLFLCCLPSTVQSSIAFTSIARGNVAAAICSASFSNLVGIVITPLLVAVLLSGHGTGLSLHSISEIVLELLVPFAAGQLLRRWIGGFVERHSTLLKLVDRGSILLVVYTAFSEGVVAGIWHRLSLPRLGVLLVVDCVLLALALAITAIGSKRLGFSWPDRVTIIFCGSKKSLASGLPMAGVLFPAGAVGLAVLPLMLFHQIQLMVCAWLAQRWSTRADATEQVEEPAAA
ncbi:bile acid:sodium symporter family protein [Actinocatenispora sera]|uniref:Bile acid:sodium symporter n=1 Tax=Actinocatenispora sera TaxID=390989 RepID=A0A810L4S2_9ACTN|nr:bile acid:sodium symporter family protein [Actinocatenispora sera]BCJ30363.1 bile acid:sodium symporter [Actinocatenispora sera]